MHYKISNELIEEIIGIELKKLEVLIDNNIIKIFNYDIELCDYTIKHKESINDFFFKCKNWAFKGGYELSSGYHIYGLQYKGHKDANKIYCDCRYYNNEEIQVRRFFANTEQQCIFDACQWIHDNNKKENKQ